jgi:hypothetical protein
VQFCFLLTLNQNRFEATQKVITFTSYRMSSGNLKAHQLTTTIFVGVVAPVIANKVL